MVALGSGPRPIYYRTGNLTIVIISGRSSQIASLRVRRAVDAHSTKISVVRAALADFRSASLLEWIRVVRNLISLFFISKVS